MSYAERFWSKVDRGDSSECWRWKGPQNVWGYGDVTYMGRRSNASRVAYLLTYQFVPAGMVVCHRCDNPWCCNPGHLFAATQSENLKDCRSKGRQRYKTGESHHRTGAKLTPEKVREARELYAAGVSQSDIGRQWGVHSSVISRAVRGESWGHVK